MTKKKPADAAEVLSPEELSKCIKSLSRTTRKLLRDGHLKRRAIVLLIHDALPKETRGGRVVGGRVANRQTVGTILDTIEQLAETYCG